MAQKYTEKKKESNRRWDSANLDRISIAVPKGKREEIKTHAEKQGESVNAFIARSVNEQIARDALQPPPGSSSAGPALDLDYGVILPHIEKTGETLPAFIGRAVSITVKSDERALRFGLNPLDED